MQTKPRATIKILQVLHGDAICIRFIGTDSKYHNIFIDGGLSSTYFRTLRKEVERVISANERIDLFVITHTDRDHIGGVLQFIKEYGKLDLVNEYWYNYSNLDTEIAGPTDKISIADGVKLRDYLRQKGRLRDREITSDILGFEECYGANLTLLSPSLADLKDYKELWRESEFAISSEELVSAEGNDYDHSVDFLSKKPFVEDRKLENRASIAFTFSISGKSILFLADSSPSVVISGLARNGYSRENKLKIDLVKLSHHASRFSTNNDLLSLLECNSFIISANGKNQYHFPHKETLSRILNHPERDLSRQIAFVFNYDNELIRSMFSKSEKAHYNFTCLYPKRDDNGYTILL